MYVITCTDFTTSETEILKAFKDNQRLDAVNFLSDHIETLKKESENKVFEIGEMGVNEYQRFYGFFFNEKRLLNKYKIIFYDGTEKIEAENKVKKN